MEDVIERITEYVVALDSTLEDHALLDFAVRDVVDRTLMYTNRQQLVPQYERDLLVYDADDLAWETYEFPIPAQLERALASVVTGYIQTATAKASSQKEVKSVSDNGQSITYGESMKSFFASTSDTEIFSGTTALLNRFRLGKVVRNNDDVYGTVIDHSKFRINS